MTRMSIVATIAIVAVLIFGDQLVRTIMAALVAVYLPMAAQALDGQVVRRVKQVARISAARFVLQRLEADEPSESPSGDAHQSGR